MKDYNEMADAVFRRRDEYLAAKKKRAAVLLKAGASVCALLLVAVVGISVWRGLPQVPSQKPTDPTATAVMDVTETKDNTTTEPESDTATAQEDTKVNSEATKKPAAATDPVESTPAGNTDKPQTETTLPPDPTEPKSDKPATDGSVDPTSATEAPNAPGADSFPGWTPDTMPQAPTTQAPTAGDDRPMTPDFPPFVTEAPCTTAVCCTLPGLDETLPGYTDIVEPTTTEPTEPPTGPLFIECDGKTYEAQVGDMVTLTVELQADEPVKSGYIFAKYGYSNLEVVNLTELGFTDKQRIEAHAPNFGNVMSATGYYGGISGKYKSVRAEFSVSEEDEALDFTQKKVFFTFSFIVMKPGNITFEIVPNDITSINGTVYFDFGNQLVTEGIELDAYLTVTPESQVKLPAPPVEEETEPLEEIPFAYPAESNEGDLIINCDGRTYSANVGDTVTYIVEMKVEKPIGGIQATLDFGDGELEIIVPESKKGKIWFPNLYGLSYNHEAGLNKDGTNDYLMKMSAIDLYGFDFKKRKVLMTFDFLVKEPGEIDLNMNFEEMYGLSTKDSYFEGSEQVNFEGIWIYEYVLVKDKSSQ